MANRLNVILAIDTSPMERALGRAEGGLNRFAKNTAKIGGLISAGITLPLLAIGKRAVEAWNIQAQAIAQVEQGIKSTGNAAGISSKRFQELASQLQGKSLFGDEEILKDVTAQLLSFTNIAGEQFEKTQVAALDLATRLDGDLKSASIQLGKALNDPVANLSALSRAGIQFSKEQKATIKSLVETNRLADAQNLILAELEKQYGGSAEAAARAGLGPLKQMQNAFGDLLEIIGRVIAEAVLPFADRAKALFERLQTVNPAILRTGVLVAALVAAVGPLLIVLAGAVKLFAGAAAGIKILIGAARALAAAFTLANAAIALPIVGIGLLIAGIVLAYREFEGFRRIVNGIGNALKTFAQIAKEAGQALFGAFEAIKEGNFKEAAKRFGEVIVKTNPVGIALTEGKRLQDAFKQGYEDDTDYVGQTLDKFKATLQSKGQEIRQSLGGTFAGANVGEDIEGAGPVSAGGATGAKRVSEALDELTPRIKLNREETLKAFVAANNLQGAYAALQITTGELDPAQLKFEAAAASANLLDESMQRLKSTLPPVASAFGSLGDSMKESLGKALDFIEQDIMPGINALAGVLDQSFANRGAAIDAYYDKEKGRIEGSRLNEEQKAAAFAKLDEETEKRRRKLARAQAIRDKALGLVSAIINTAKAVTSALPNIPLAAIVGALGAVQVGLIASQAIPALASGGITTGPTLALVGDNKSGKEAIIPFERMGEFLDKYGGGGATRVTGVFEVRGQDLILVLDRAQQQQIRVR